MARGERVEKRGDLHAVRGGQINYMNNGITVGDVKYGGVRRSKAKPMPRCEVNEVGEFYDGETVDMVGGRRHGEDFRRAIVGGA